MAQDGTRDWALAITDAAGLTGAVVLVASTWAPGGPTWASCATGPGGSNANVRMPGRDGIEATRAIVAAGLPSKVLILTTFDLDDYVYAGLRAGASGFLLKDTQPDDLANAICIIAAGEAILAPTVTRRLIGQFSVQPPGPPSGRRASQTQEAQIRDTQIRKTQIRKTQIRKTLTDRELDVFSRIATGMSNGEIAASLHLSEGTVKVHVGRILAKLGLRDRVQAVVLAYESTLIIPVTPPDAVSPGHGG